MTCTDRRDSLTIPYCILVIFLRCTRPQRPATVQNLHCTHVCILFHVGYAGKKNKKTQQHKNRTWQTISNSQTVWSATRITTFIQNLWNKLLTWCSVKAGPRVYPQTLCCLMIHFVVWLLQKHGTETISLTTYPALVLKSCRDTRV